MCRDQTVATVLREKVVAIVRLDDAAHVVPAVQAIHAGGVRCIEVSLTTPGALDAIREARERIPGALLGAGTVCSAEDAEAAMRAGAEFLVTPVTLPELVGPAHARGVALVMGAFSPTEMFAAARAGADLVKLFPASSVGPNYLRAVLAPLPGLRLVPTGGVGADNAREWLAAGAVAVGVGGSLADAGTIAAGRFDAITWHARRLMEAIQ